MLLSLLTQNFQLTRHGEQGIVTLKLDFKDDPSQGDVKLWTFQSGIATNVIPQTAHAQLEGDIDGIKEVQLIPERACF